MRVVAVLVAAAWWWPAAGLLAQEAVDATPATEESPATSEAEVVPEPVPAASETVSDADSDPTPGADQAPPEADPFYKGELGSPGASELENPNDAFFVGIGYYNVGGSLGQHYARITPSVDLHFDVGKSKELVLRLAAPFNMLLYDRKSKLAHGGFGSLRSQDYDEVGDYLRAIRQIRLGRKEDKLFVNVALTHSVSLGHGTVMRRYNANLDPDRSRLGLQLDAYNDYAGFESFIADLAMQTRIMGGLAFIKPASFFSDNAVARTWSVGVHYTTDLAAPRRLRREASAGGIGRVQVDAAGFPEYDAVQVGILGVDSEIKPVKIGNLVDLKVYADYSKLLGAGGGTSGGLLLRSNFGARPSLSALRVRLEGRLYDHNYVPQYFDSLYEVNKMQVVRGKPTGLEPTKYEAVVDNKDGDSHASVYAEATYALVKQLVVGIGLERLLDEQSNNLLVDIEVPAFEFLRFYASYQKLGYRQLSKSFATVHGKSFSFESNTVLFSQARLMVLPILFVSGGLKQTYQWNADFRAPDGTVIGAYRPKLDFLFEVELGWELD